MEKAIKKYEKIYKSALTEVGYPDIAARVNDYRKRLRQMYASEAFANHNIYPSMDVHKVYAVIAMCLELKRDNLSDGEIIDIINGGFKKLRQLLAALERVIDSLPYCYKIAKRWNISDHGNRVKDGSITYDCFSATENKIEYRISRCMYVEMFEHFGIRSLCKIFCITDEAAYSNLMKHVKFIRHSDLSDGSCCHDEIYNTKHL